MAVAVLPLSSGSSGNATLVTCGSTRVLVDAGLSSKALAERLQAVSVDPESEGGVALRPAFIREENHGGFKGCSAIGAARERDPPNIAVPRIEPRDVSVGVSGVDRDSR